MWRFPFVRESIIFTIIGWVVLQGRTGRKMVTQLGYVLPLAHQFDFSQAELFAFGQVLGRFVGQVRLAECAWIPSCTICALPPKLFSRGTDASRRGTRECRATSVFF